MAQIATLDENMVNMIAAGEVIERPASVVKELMENSIDAGASQISVSIEDGGKKLISVSDNGCGMDGEDFAKAFESHATSKIKTTNDLRAISTLGFRGEALASVASVAAVKAVSRTKDSPHANCIEIDCGRKVQVRPCSADYGTNIEVRDLFYKLPARRKFLRTTNTELGHITEQFTRMALANTQMDLTMSHNGREIHRLCSGQPLRERIAELFSDELAGELIETTSEEKGLSIFAMLAPPGLSRTSNKFQYVFLNGRFIRDKFISHAIKEAYRGVIEPDRFGVIFLFIKMPHEDYDVNVHPTKIEVRFYNANLVHSQILAALRERLLSASVETPATLRPQTGPRRAEVPQRKEHSAAERINQAVAEFLQKHASQHQRRLDYAPTQVVTSPVIRQTGTQPVYEPLTVTQKGKTEIQQKFLQIHDSFIVTQTEDGIVIVDQHALHERILYNELKERIASGNLESQKLLIPETFQITGSQRQAAEAQSGVLERLGIELAPFGPKSMAVQAFPTLLAKAAPAEFVRDLLDLLADKQTDIEPARLIDQVISLAACKAAIKAGQRLSDAEMGQLLLHRDQIDFAGRCPHGRPTAIKLSLQQLYKQFKRT